VGVETGESRILLNHESKNLNPTILEDEKVERVSRRTDLSCSLVLWTVTSFLSSLSLLCYSYFISNHTMSRILNAVAFVVAFAATLIGVLLYTELPKKLGLYKFWSQRQPKLIGMTPAFHYHVEPWRYTFEELYGNDLTGQRAVVTGASSGIGYAAARVLAELGAEVVMGCRNSTKCRIRADEIRETVPGAKLFPATIDTSSFRSVRNFADEYKAKFSADAADAASASGGGGDALDMLFLNAGTAYNPNATHPCVPVSSDNVEYVFQTNYAGHHLLYLLLQESMFKSRHKPATVVQTSSSASFGTYSYKVATDLETLNGCNESAIRPGENLSYGQSKLAQILWVKELTKRLEASGNGNDVVANAFHPGFVATEMVDKIANIPPLVRKMVHYALKNGLAWNSTEGALTGLYLGVERDRLVRENAKGRYYHPQVIEVDNPLANDEQLQKKLWDFTTSLVEPYLS